MFSLIVAMSKNGVIGDKGEIPWYLPTDLKHFAQITKGHSVIMGRKTYDSIIKRLGHPLPNRDNIVLTSQLNFSAPDCTIVHNLDEILRIITKNEEVFVIGGSEIYRIFLPIANKLYITAVEINCEGDVLFPEYNEAEWTTVSSVQQAKDDKNKYDCTFLELVKK